MIGVLVFVACGCGPSADGASPSDASWLLGVYSLQAPTTPGGQESAENNDVDRYTFEEAGAGVRQKISGTRVVDEFVLTWELKSVEEAFAHLVPYDEANDDSYIIRPGLDCNTIELTYVHPNGGTLGPAPLYRGEVCARAPDPETHAYFERYWCDEPPPPCEDP